VSFEGLPSNSIHSQQMSDHREVSAKKWIYYGPHVELCECGERKQKPGCPVQYSYVHKLDYFDAVAMYVEYKHPVIRVIGEQCDHNADSQEFEWIPIHVAVSEKTGLCRMHEVFQKKYASFTEHGVSVKTKRELFSQKIKKFEEWCAVHALLADGDAEDRDRCAGPCTPVKRVRLECDEVLPPTLEPELPSPSSGSPQPIKESGYIQIP